ncbi:hypothetical protein FM125_11230 [Micrococcus lylae]|uniref:Uncharacterized protein n=1 Tax=Micrococcus lylae TaxID=1273 RepID=A0A1R4JYC2_9MICC|nr:MULTISPECIES: hypothetical protein [Micrococcus]MCT2006854.1 hypothetical protein [Micrococcus lylae]MCT2070674.1 hypothetical protein [Micrococcus lylae]WIK81821.1 hypothetical protein CJ228_009465 [Micrococcus lylae]SJN36763.1 hypothetical protein FM125_11230 [Micrococcus lylae]
MSKLSRVAVAAVAAAAAWGLRSWQQAQQDRKVWASATDELPEDEPDAR